MFFLVMAAIAIPLQKRLNAFLILRFDGLARCTGTRGPDICPKCNGDSKRPGHSERSKNYRFTTAEHFVNCSKSNLRVGALPLLTGCVMTSGAHVIGSAGSLFSCKPVIRSSSMMAKH